MIPRHYQSTAVRGLWNAWVKNPNAKPLIVAPCGAGKSIILSLVCQDILKHKPNWNICVITHKSKIVQQNAKQLGVLLQIPIGVYCAKLKRKDVARVTCGSVNSMYKKSWDFDMVICDEAHLWSGEDSSMYNKFFSQLPSRVKVFGLTATPYRLDQGSLVGEDCFFTNIAYEIKMGDLIEQGFLSPLVSKRSNQNSISLKGVNKVAGDYEKGLVAERMLSLTQEQVLDIIQEGQDRKHWLVFCASIAHAKEMAQEFRNRGIKAAHLASDMLEMEQERVLAQFHTGEIQALCNIDMLTIGYDFPNLDLIALCFSTMSASKYLQIGGRVSRIAEGKVNGKVLDFGRNIERLGPLDAVVGQGKKGGDGEGLAPVKFCDDCGLVNAIRTLTCECGFKFDIKTTLEPKAAVKSILMETKEFDVEFVRYRVTAKTPPSFQINFHVRDSDGNSRTILEWLPFETGRKFALQKWELYAGTEPPETAQEALLRQDEMKSFSKLQVTIGGKFDRILNVAFKEKEKKLDINPDDWDDNPYNL